MSEITTKEIYDLVNKLDEKLSIKIDKVYVAFMELEAGRLSSVEKKLTEIVAEHKPVKAIVYGMTGFILLAVLSALVYLVVKRSA